MSVLFIHFLILILLMMLISPVDIHILLLLKCIYIQKMIFIGLIFILVSATEFHIDIDYYLLVFIN